MGQELLTTIRDGTKEENKHWIVAPFFILFSVILSLPLSSALESNVVAIENVTVSPGGEVVVPIKIERSTGIGGIGVKLSYDPSVVNVTNVTMGDFITFFSFDNANTANGWIVLNTYILGQNLADDVTVADITLEAVGNAGDSSNLDLTILSMADQFGTDVNGTTNDGVFAISSPSEAGSGTNNDGITTPHPTATPSTTPTSTPPTPSPTSIPANRPESSSTPGSTINPTPLGDTSTPTPQSTSVPSSQQNTATPATPPVISNVTTPVTTPTPRTPGFKAVLGIAVILLVATWLTGRSKEKS